MDFGPWIHQDPSAIFNGKKDTAHTATGALLYGNKLCTATLVGVKTVLTAAHCIEKGAPYLFRVGGKDWPVSTVVAHPEFSITVYRYDLAVLKLKAAPPVTPASLSTRPPDVGQIVTLVGFGETESGGGIGTRRVTLNTVAGMVGDRFRYTGWGGGAGNTCYGDSGGPTFAGMDGRELQVGVHSAGLKSCGVEGYDTRVDMYLEWIRQVSDGDVFVDDQISPLADDQPPTVIIDSPLDEGKVSSRDQTVNVSVSDNVAVTRVDLVVDGQPVESRNAPPYRFTLDLPPGRHGIAVGALDPSGNRGDHQIHFTVVEPAPFGDTCEGSEFCESDICADHPDLASSYCSQTCQPEQASCPDGVACLSAGEDLFICGPPQSLLASEGASEGCSLVSGRSGSGGGAMALSLWMLALLLLQRSLRRRPGAR